MADIQSHLDWLMDAERGEDVRGSIRDAIAAINSESIAAKDASSLSAQAAENSAREAADSAEEATNAANAAREVQKQANEGDLAGTVQIGTVITSDPGTSASVENSGTPKDAVLNFEIPRGDTGVPGASFRMRKTWESGTPYVNDSSHIDVVAYKGGTYGCLISHTSSDELTPDSSEYWQCIAEKGETGTVENIGETKIEFTIAEKLSNISKDDSLSVILGKLEKIVSELKTYNAMIGATAEEAGSEGLVPAPGMGMQDAFLQGSGLWKNLGAAAFLGVVNNRDTTEEGFLADARQLKEIQDQIDLQNSTLENIGGGSETNLPNGAFVYVLKTSSISFVNASGNTNVSTVYGALDYFKNEISKHEAGCINFVYPAAGYNFPIIFSKLGTQGAVGMIMDYTNSKPPVFFNFYNNKYRIFDPQSAKS